MHVFMFSVSWRFVRGCKSHVEPDVEMLVYPSASSYSGTSCCSDIEQLFSKAPYPSPAHQYATVTFVAIGNGAPDLSANISAIRSGSVLLSAGALTGECVHVVAACVHVYPCAAHCFMIILLYINVHCYISYQTRYVAPPLALSQYTSTCFLCGTVQPSQVVFVHLYITCAYISTPVNTPSLNTMCCACL